MNGIMAGMAFVLVFLLLVVLAAPASGKVITVDFGGNGDFSTISEAVSYALDGDKVVVYPGTYEDNVRVTKSLNIAAKNEYSKYLALEDAAIIRESKNDPLFHVTADEVRLSGFVLIVSSSENTGIFLEGANNCTITDNTISAYGSDVNCINLENSSYNLIAYNNLDPESIEENPDTSESSTLLLNSTHNLLHENRNIKNNVILYRSSHNTITNSENYKSYIHLDLSDNNTLKENLVQRSKWNGIWLTRSNNNTLIGNSVKSGSLEPIGPLDPEEKTPGNLAGIQLSHSNNNVLRDNSVLSNWQDGIGLAHSDRNELYNNMVEYNFGLGIVIHDSRGNTVEGNSLKGAEKTGAGIDLENLQENKISNNTISNFKYGVLFEKPANPFDKSLAENNYFSDNRKDLKVIPLDLALALLLAGLLGGAFAYRIYGRKLSPQRIKMLLVLISGFFFSYLTGLLLDYWHSGCELVIFSITTVIFLAFTSIIGISLFISATKDVMKKWYFEIPLVVSLIVIVLSVLSPYFLPDISHPSYALRLLAAIIPGMTVPFSLLFFFMFPADIRKKMNKVISVLTILTVFTLICSLFSGVHLLLYSDENIFTVGLGIIWLLLMPLTGICYWAAALNSGVISEFSRELEQQGQEIG
ncbi:hypothetical protein FTO70_06630 [Methanosarcina sp. KYL-1]|uniref:NosD domain-containing protein n=1 Tax=Methanosarcina sp. KYL-1 TaxID=2602068 RepID=UPI0021014F9E|nr:NosD domain-containing protein [Methanosarcina sp. KYL-1]MCQ1535369.1 hypothetical protein [Methanosarcina sp. KYL-1]